MIQKRCTPYWFKIMIVMTAMVLSTGVAWAGSLEPPAEAVDGSGNPVPTTTEALEKLDRIILQPIDDGDIRFVNFPFLGRVLDNRTGLEWEQSPSTTTRNHADSIAHCDGLSLGGQDNWRLPERDELASLVDLDSPGGTDLPPGHPFSNVQSNYWSATLFPDTPTAAWVVGFGNPPVLPTSTGDSFGAWCVR